ncbi:hypothetical protein INT43_004895 [Umbelopsis isabellina]|uniref:RING-type domain-containing protein n=1 Tax=Mortierella isabellina TaxID=91625 RepID=A0A8H7PEB7_MORIS|nr:hypothetical protein INT43_004895 [Umbelopsis isabellina]
MFFSLKSGESRHVSRFVPCSAVQLTLLMLPSKLQRGRQLAQLISLFPDADPNYLLDCLAYYESDHIERISDKMLSFNGHYPRRSAHSEPGSVHMKNEYLKYLATELFPDCHVTLLRQCLLEQKHSHIEAVCESILQRKQLPVRLQSGSIERHELITSERYRAHALARLTHEYPNVWKSSIRAVMAENNYSYIKSHAQLAEMGSGGFWVSIRNLIRHWSPASSSSTLPANEDSPELAEELQILRHKTLEVQKGHDHKLAVEVNEKEYAAAGEFIPCECCFDDCTFESLYSCSTGDHLFCQECIQRFISEGIFGQGNLRGVSPIACMNSSSDCEGIFTRQTLEAALTTNVWKTYEQSLTNEEISRSSLSVVQCPFCEYCEVDDNIRPLPVIQEYIPLLVFVTACIVELPVVLIIATWLRGMAAYLTLLFVHISVQWTLHFADWRDQVRIAHKRIQERHRGRAFQCRNSSCGKLSCLLCHNAVKGLHSCKDDAQDGYRLYVEKAMADAVKRTCPVCSLSFQKSDGCNKMTCRCGYTMCYVCRKDIGKESYAHFCQHFRELPGRACGDCSKCDLYKTESEDLAVRRAARKARQEYLAAHPEVQNQMEKSDDYAIGPPTATEAIYHNVQTNFQAILERILELIV